MWLWGGEVDRRGMGMGMGTRMKRWGKKDRERKARCTGK